MDNTKPTAVLSLSGGMDSTCLLIDLLAQGLQVHCLSFNYGQKHKVELERASNNIQYLQSYGFPVTHQILDISWLGKIFHSALTTEGIKVPEGHYEEGNMKATVVPNRNAIFSSIIYGYALSLSSKSKQQTNIYLGIHSGDHAIYPDCRQEFRDALEYAFQIGNWDSELVKYEAPFLHLNKTSILEKCLLACKKINVNFDFILANTLTSYNPDSEGRSSGTSGSDIERIEAFINIGRPDPTPYVKPWSEIEAHAREVLGLK